MRATAAALAALVLVAVACSGDDGEPAGAPATTAAAGTQTGASELPPLDGGTADPAPGRILLSFVRAAGKGDARAMWNLLSEPTQASIGPTLADFTGGAAANFQAGLGTLAPSAKVILSRRLADDWAVAAVAGERTEQGEREYFAYGAALLREEGALKLELGGVVITGYEPEPLAEIDEALPDLGANVGAGGDLGDVRMWLDGKPVDAQRGADDTPFTASLSARPEQPLDPGEHELVVFAATSETATATAWTFRVKG